jgi:hypothetical protein
VDKLGLSRTLRRLDTAVMSNREERVDDIAHNDRALEKRASEMVSKPKSLKQKFKNIIMLKHI